MQVLKYIILFIISTSLAFAQQSINLKDCYKKAVESYPLKKQLKQQDDISKLKIENFNVAYYPEINLIGQAQYQSDVTKLDLKIPIPNFKLPEATPKDQYKIGLNINQLVWDGGRISEMKNLEQGQSEINRQSTEVELYKLKQKVNDVYFNMLLMDVSIKTLSVTKKDIEDKLNQVKVTINNGAALQTNADILEAEILKIDQSINDLRSYKKTAANILSELVDYDISENALLELPNIAEPKVSDNKLRPEYNLFELNRKQLDKSLQATDKKDMPVFSAFGQLMYGQPGLNMFDPSFQPFYIVGVKASWNVWNWNSISREKEILKIQKELINTQESVFNKNLKISIKQQINDIDKIEKNLEKDKEIIALKKKIIASVSSKLDNGTVTSTEFLTEKNSETKAILTMEQHKLELLKAKIDLQTQLGYEF